jgi:hypothetical protein
MGGTFVTLLIVFIVLGIFFKMGPQEAAQEQKASAPEPEAPAPPSPPSSSGGSDDAFKAPGS